MQSFQKRERLIFDNQKGDTLEFSVSSPFFPDSADGMEFLENEIYSVSNYNEDGTNVKGSSVKPRNIILNGRIRIDKDINRQRLIRFFNPKDTFIFKYTNGDITRYIDCRIEKTPVISRDTFPAFMISFICPNPWWYTEEQKSEIALWISSFEFELELAGDGVEMGYREPNNVVNIFNDSDVISPLRVQFKAIGSVVNPKIEVVGTGRFIVIEATLQGGDIVMINTQRGKEYVTLYRNNTEINYFNFLSLDSDIHLAANVGDNLIRYSADEFISNLEVAIYFTPQFTGV